MKTVAVLFCLLGIAVCSAGVTSSVRADVTNKKAVITFAQPVEVPGKVLPAGSYTFQQLDSPTDRHIVQIFSADGTQLDATVLAITDYRLQSTGDSVMKFTGLAKDSPDALRAWFYPGDTFAQEFVYPKTRAMQLAQTTHVAIPAFAADTIDDSSIKTIAIVAETPDQKEVDVTTVVQSRPNAAADATTTPDAVVATPVPAVAVVTPAPDSTVVTTTPVATVTTTTPDNTVVTTTPAATVTTPTPDTTVVATTPATTVTTPAQDTAVTTPAPAAEVVTPAPVVAETSPAPIAASDTKEMPQTAGAMPLIALLGGLSISLALGLKLFLKLAS